uniref:Uncharacterized protein n=1 Tax=Myoviridae sp. ctwwN25 TaxID=2825209 RepID=A0A8S5PQ35_9CAUD|nr:MAG TPA: hypothetical protein [Myoviridae sp. ctwwN25]
MAIISANRFSKMNGNFIIAANESYGVEDMGRILVENERNDQAIFTAALMSDMHEIKCRTEGTLLESELQSLSESSVKEFFNSIIEKLKKFWAKIKGFFKRAYAMITAYVVRNGKAFIAANRKELDKLANDAPIKGEFYVPAGGNAEKLPYSANYEKITKDMIDPEGEYNEGSSEINKRMLIVAVNGFDGEGNVYKYLKEKNFSKKSNGSLADWGGKSKVMAIIENGMTPVKNLRHEEREAEKAIKSAIKALESQAKSDKNNTEKSNEEHEAAGKKLNYYRAATSGMTSAMSTCVSATIKMQKFMLAQARIALAKAIAKNNVTESTLLESEIRQIIEDASEMEDSTPAPGEDPEVDAAAEKVVDAVEELIDSAAENAADEGGDAE